LTAKVVARVVVSGWIEAGAMLVEMIVDVVVLPIVLTHIRFERPDARQLWQETAIGR
jgi:hypothetical protein